MEPLARTSGIRHWTPRVAPAITTTTVLIAARAWNADGAEHSIGAAILMGSLAVGSAGFGIASAGGENSNPTITALSFAGAGAFATAGVAAYSDGLPLPILLWLLATIAVYAVCSRYWREDLRAELDHQRAMEKTREDHRHGLQVEALRGKTAERVAETTRDAAYAAQLLAAHAHRQMLDVHPDLAGIDAAAKILFDNDAEQVDR